jgi:hypothetical protein
MRLKGLLLGFGDDQALDEESWKRNVLELHDILSPLTGETPTSSAKEFVEWLDVRPEVDSESSKVSASKGSVNIFRVGSEESFAVDLEVSTIHAVKGETHLATLLLETYWYKHDLRELVPFLAGQGDRKLFEKKRPRERAKRVFVAMTRPRELLCLAMRKDHLNEELIQGLIVVGWVIQDLTV